MNPPLHLVWSAQDYRDVFERAATHHAVQAANAPVVDLFTGEVIR